MVFKTDKQRKAVMAKLNINQTKSQTRPSIIGRIRGAEQRLVQRIKERRQAKALETERKGRERIVREQQALEKEKITAQRLRQELEVEQARETVAEQRRETEAEFSKLESERFARTKRGKAIALARKGVTIGIKKLRQAPARKPRRKKAPRREEPLPFGI